MSLSTGDNPSTFPSASRPLGHPLTQVDLESNSDLAHTDHAAFVSVMQTRLRILPRITRPKGPHDRADEHALGRAFVELERAYNDHWRMNSETERDPRVAYWFADVLFRLEGYACALEVIDDLRCLSSMRSAFLDETREMVVRAQAVQDARSVERLRLAMLHPAGQSYVYKPGNLAPLPDALPDLPGLIIPLVAPGAVSLAPDELTRLVRAISIHTNLIEGIFSLDLPSTCALVDHTFPAPDDLLRHGNNDPKYVQDVLIDTQEATQYVLDRARSDTTTICASTFVQALHRTITRTACVASYSGSEPGTRTSTYIGRGEFKRVSNHVFARTRKFHIYCPPQFVERELVTLLEMLKLYLEKPAPQPPYAYGLWLAAWFHHRFVNIHPFRDGNGRVTRCLTTGILTHYGFLPLYVSIHDKPDYLSALMDADAGRLEPLVKFFARQQLQALLAAKTAPLSQVSRVPNSVFRQRRIAEAQSFLARELTTWLTERTTIRTTSPAADTPLVEVTLHNCISFLLDVTGGMGDDIYVLAGSLWPLETDIFALYVLSRTPGTTSDPPARSEATIRAVKGLLYAKDEATWEMTLREFVRTDIAWVVGHE